MRRAARLDGNHRAIVEALERMGCSVQSLAACGKGVPDLLVGSRDRNTLLEIKDSAKPESKRKLTPAQKDWHAKWKGKVSVVTTPLEALEAVMGVEPVPVTDRVAYLCAMCGSLWRSGSPRHVCPKIPLHIGPPPPQRVK